MNSKTLKILNLLEFLGVLKGGGGVDAEAVKALCKAYEDVNGVAPATALEAIAWAVNVVADFEGVELTVSSSELAKTLEQLSVHRLSCS
jgi:hypothetical protein